MTAPTKCVDRICRGVQGTPAGERSSPLRVLLVAAYGSREDGFIIIFIDFKIVLGYKYNVE